MRTGPFRGIYFVARLDLASALRSRRAIAALLLYVLAVLGATYLFCLLIQTVQETVGDATTISDALARDRRFRRLVEGLTGDKEIAERLITMPPLALFFGWLSVNFLPFLTVVNSSDAIASQVRTGESRFILFRSGRLPFALGTFVAHGLLMTIGLALGAVGSLVMGAMMLGVGTSLAATGPMFSIGAATWFYSFAYLGLAVGMSQLVDSASAARGLAFGAFFCLAIGAGLLRVQYVAEMFPTPLLPVVKWFFPQAHSLDLWRLSFLGRLPAMASLFVLGVLYFLPGWMYFRRRDL